MFKFVVSDAEADAAKGERKQWILLLLCAVLSLIIHENLPWN